MARYQPPGARHAEDGRSIQASSGSAAINRRRTYALPSSAAKASSSGQGRKSSLRRGDAGFEGISRPFREPLTPNTHDNKTGKGRISNVNRRMYEKREAVFKLTAV